MMKPYVCLVSQTGRLNQFQNPNQLLEQRCLESTGISAVRQFQDLNY